MTVQIVESLFCHKPKVRSCTYINGYFQLSVLLWASSIEGSVGVWHVQCKSDAQIDLLQHPFQFCNNTSGVGTTVHSDQWAAYNQA